MRATFLIFLIFVFSACGTAKPPLQPASSAGDMVSGTWSPDQIDVQCRVNEGCPSQVGLLFFLFPAKDGKSTFRRCTAFLTGSNQVTSNAHCDHLASGTKGYFITAGVHRVVRSVKRTLFKRQGEAGRPDVAIFELDQEVDDVRPLSFARRNEPIYTRLEGFVINAGGDANHYVIDKLDCAVRRHEALYPFDLKENPDVITAFGCASAHGNSGAPLFAPGRSSVQAILQAKSERRPRFSFERHNTVVATNARCVREGENCLPVDFVQTQKRFQTYQMREFNALRERQSENMTAGVRFRGVRFELPNDVSGEYLFEMFYEPVCRLSDSLPQVIVSPAEKVRVSFNSWGEAETKVIETRETRWIVTRVHGQRLEISAEWAEPFGNLVRAGEHPRRTWGRSFSIDLPRCAR